MPVQPQCTYPRPDFERSNLQWASLNGQWDFIFDDEDVGVAKGWPLSGLPAKVELSNNTCLDKIQITVPFVFQTAASGVNIQDAHEVIWYERSIDDVRTPNHITSGYRTLLRFGAVDYEATVWMNGYYVGDHQGGHVPFTIDITDALQLHNGGNRLTLRYWKPQPESIFYTPSSGIWQTVWLESVPPTRIAESSEGTLLRSNNIESGFLYADIHLVGQRGPEPVTVGVTSTLGGAHVNATKQEVPPGARSVHIELSMRLSTQYLRHILSDYPPTSDRTAWKTVGDECLALWSPEHPLLYNITIALLNSSGNIVDEVHTSVGMRSISWNNSDNTFRLNGQPYFQALVLDQGYWPDSNMTPPSPDALKADIEISKAMGFNGCRKHQKVEDPLFLYWADRLGYLVWGEMANAYEFSATYVERFDAEWKQAMKRDINHACIVAWTPINESWGYDDLKGRKQHRDHIRSLYYSTKTLDPTRPINDNCGWEHVKTDLSTFHEYADAPELKEVCASMDGILGNKGGRCLFVPPIDEDPGSVHSSRAPIICTEFGGVNIAPAQGAQAGYRDWGYTTARDPEDLLKRVEALIMAVVDGGLCCGFVYTQLTDIEQEVNGLYAFDRRPKLDVERVRDIMDKAKSRYFELLRQRTRSASQDCVSLLGER